VAEFWNTLSSVPIALCGLSGVLLCRAQCLGPEQMACYAALGVIGIGSFAFHATLMRTGQVLDEVPMLWAAVALLYCTWHHSVDRRRRRQALAPNTRRLALVGGGLLVYAVVATTLYFATGFLTFIVAYALSVVALVVFSIAIFASATPLIGPTPRRLLATAACVYGGGALLLWLPTELLCHRVPLMRRLPLHALFHLTSAAGPHLGLTAFALAVRQLVEPVKPHHRRH
jgi:dihydroceramidase